MARVFLMLKKSASQIGYGKLTTFERSRFNETRVQSVALLTEQASQAAFAWRKYNNNWRFRIVDADDFGGGSFATYETDAMYDDVMKLKVQTPSSLAARARALAYQTA